MESELVIAYITTPSMEIAQKIAQNLVENKLAACVNLCSPVHSIYTWQGSLLQDEEVLMIVKTRNTQLAAIESTLKELHPYELPELIAVPIAGGSSAYMDWVTQNTKQ